MEIIQAGGEGPVNPDVVRETTEDGQIVWLNSAPEEGATSVPVLESPEV